MKSKGKGKRKTDERDYTTPEYDVNHDTHCHSDVIMAYARLYTASTCNPKTSVLSMKFFRFINNIMNSHDVDEHDVSLALTHNLKRIRL